mgnify:FL=1
MEKNRKKVFEFLDQFGMDALVADGFDDAIVGVVLQDEHPKVVYDSYKCIDMLIEEGMSEEEATEYFDYNVSGSYVGKQTPIFIYPISGI